MTPADAGAGAAGDLAADVQRHVDEAVASQLAAARSYCPEVSSSGCLQPKERKGSCSGRSLRPMQDQSERCWRRREARVPLSDVELVQRRRAGHDIVLHEVTVMCDWVTPGQCRDMSDPKPCTYVRGRRWPILASTSDA